MTHERSPQSLSPSCLAQPHVRHIDKFVFLPISQQQTADILIIVSDKKPTVTLAIGIFEISVHDLLRGPDAIKRGTVERPLKSTIDCRNQATPVS